jgi:hypothetical protein
VLSFPASGKDAIVTLQASDAFAWLADEAAPQSPYGIALTQLASPPSAYWPLHEPTSTRQFVDVIGDSHGMWSNLGDSGGPSQPASTATTRSLVAGMIGKAGTRVTDTSIADIGVLTASFWVEVPETTSTFRVLIGTSEGGIGLDYGFSGSYFVTDGSSDYVVYGRLEPGSHHVWLESDGISVINMWVDGNQVSVDYASTATATLINFGLNVDGQNSTVSDVSVGGDYFADLEDLIRAGADGRTNDTSYERMAWLLTAAGVPSGLQNMTTDNSTFLGPSGAGSTYGDLCRQVNAAEAGRLHVKGNGDVTFRSRLYAITSNAGTVSQGTFTDAFADITLQPADVSDVINEATVTITGGAAGTFRDEDSIALYGLQSSSFTAPLNGVGAAVSMARHYVGLRNHPHTRVAAVTLNPRNTPATMFPQVLGRDIGDRITAVRNVTGTLRPAVTTSPISAQVTIEGITHRISRKNWSTTWTTVPAPLTSAEAGYFTFDDAVLGMFDAGLSYAP